MTKADSCWMGLHDSNAPLEQLDVAIVGVPYDGSVSHAAGAAEAPAMLRKAPSQLWPHTEDFASLRELRLRDFGDVPAAEHDVQATQTAITSRLQPIVEAGVIPVVLAGDHSITSGAVTAFGAKRNLGVL